MNKKILIVFAFAMLTLTTAVFAHFGGNYKNGYITEQSNYDHFVNLKTKLGFNMMSWVDSEEDFETMKKYHSQMKGFRGKGMHKGGCFKNNK
jgi:hypothetical protein